MGNKILIVEDEFIVANDLRLLLTQTGYRVLGIVASAEEADEFMQTSTPDLVLLDIQLEGKKSGIDLAWDLRAKHIAFVYLSANSSQKILEEAKATQPYGFLVKPFREKDLLVTLDIAWYRHQFSLESKLRQEELLQKQLENIRFSGDQEKLLEITRALQPHIPFDLLLSGTQPSEDQQLRYLGFLRTGLDEYQAIGEKELSTVTGLDIKTISSMTPEPQTRIEPFIYPSPLTLGSANDSLQDTMMDSFKMQSALVLPLTLSDGRSYRYLFYSRQETIYNSDHLSLARRISKMLTQVTERRSKEGDFPVLGLPRLIDNKSTGRTNHHPAFDAIIGSHPLLQAALDLITQVAPYNTSVLILGESGTGKERIAQAIHALSPRNQKPFVKVNCAAIPPTLVESELFGHERGAFTGAVDKRKGKFEQADGGTIFLDEIGELPLGMQVKLLRVLQEKEIEYVGGTNLKKLNVRILAATNRNLEQEVAAGNFRLDLYYRLNVFPITLPSLRERKGDITALASFFAEKFCTEFNKDFCGIAETMLEEMHAYHWPGNIRELENIIEQSVVLSDGRSRLELKRSLSTGTADLKSKPGIETFKDVKQVQMETEKEYIEAMLKKTQGRIRGLNGAAELLEIKPTTLESKMARLGIRADDFKHPAANS